MRDFCETVVMINWCDAASLIFLLLVYMTPSLDGKKYDEYMKFKKNEVKKITA